MVNTIFPPLLNGSLTHQVTEQCPPLPSISRKKTNSAVDGETALPLRRSFAQNNLKKEAWDTGSIASLLLGYSRGGGVSLPAAGLIHF